MLTRSAECRRWHRQHLSANGEALPRAEQKAHLLKTHTLHVPPLTPTRQEKSRLRGENKTKRKRRWLQHARES